QSWAATTKAPLTPRPCGDRVPRPCRRAVRPGPRGTRSGVGRGTFASSRADVGLVSLRTRTDKSKRTDPDICGPSLQTPLPYLRSAGGAIDCVGVHEDCW